MLDIIEINDLKVKYVWNLWTLYMCRHFRADSFTTLKETLLKKLIYDAGKPVFNISSKTSVTKYVRQT